MAIRFTCSGCSSEMKIRDELAGSAARCPKCKTKFVVPSAAGQNKDSASDAGPPSNRNSSPGLDDSSPQTPARRPSSRSSHSNSSNTDPAETLPLGADNLPLAAFNPDETLRLEESDDAIPTDYRQPASGGLSDSDDAISTPKSPSTTGRPQEPVAGNPTSEIAAETLGLDDDEVEMTSGLQQQASRSGMSASSESPALTAAVPEDLDSPPLMVAHPILAKTSVFVAKEYAQQEMTSRSSDTSSKSTRTSRPASDHVAFDPAKFLMSDRPKTDPEIAPSKPDSRESDRRESDHYEVSRRDFERREPERQEEIPDFTQANGDTSEFHDRPTARPFNRPTPATKSSAPRPQPEKIDLATAAKMMKKAIKDNQAEEAHQRELDARAGFDFAGFFREFGLKGMGILLGAVIVSYGLYYMADRVFSNSIRLPKMGYVTGVIKLNGKPLSGAVINFSPIEAEFAGTKRERIRTSVGVSDDQGQFRMMYLPAERIEGVAVGRCRVWVTHVGPTGKSDVPAEWGEFGGVTREVTAGKQAAPFDINLESKTR